MMQTQFNPLSFKRVELADRDRLQKILFQSKESSCEFSFANLYMWGFAYRSHWQEFNGRIYLYMLNEDRKRDELMFSSSAERNDDPETDELLAVSDAMIQAGFSGSFQHVRKEYIEARPELERHFRIESVERDFEEYIYSVADLAALPGAKLSKKRNLIAQFKRDWPDCCVRLIDESNLQDCIGLSEIWRQSHPDPDAPNLRLEAEALKHLTDNFNQLGIVGLGAYADGKMVAFEMCSRINADMFTEHFEKSLHEYKGASQYINQETAKHLIGQCSYLNREQDLGSEGLRQAKLSYAPLYLLRNFRLIRK